MEVKISTKIENPLLSRSEIKGSLTAKGATPSRMDVKKAVAENLKKDEKLVVVSEIQNKFGSDVIEFSANVYNTEDDIEENESYKTWARNAALYEKKEGSDAEAGEVKEAQQKEEQPSAEEKADKPAESSDKKAKPTEEKVEDKKEAPAKDKEAPTKKEEPKKVETKEAEGKPEEKK